MPVVINDFQVIDSEQEQSGQSAPPASSSQAGNKPVASRGREMEKLLRHIKARQCRIHAD